MIMDVNRTPLWIFLPIKGLDGETWTFPIKTKLIIYSGFLASNSATVMLSSTSNNFFKLLAVISSEVLFQVYLADTYPESRQVSFLKQFHHHKD